ncbi:MAG: polysaccharide biosynthesis protein [Lachnospiraceae bacterium]|nr:polysaccharide biosynthesis protein [Lachnospiraceae bacterium]
MNSLWKDFFTKAPNTKFTKIPIVRILALVFLDIMTSLICSFLAIYIRYDFRMSDIEPRFWNAYVAGMVPIVLITLGCFAVFGLYNSVWRYASANELVKIVVSTLAASLLFLAESRLTKHYLPRSYYPFYWVFIMFATCLVRFGYRILRLINAKRKDLFSHSEISNVMVVGAGAAGNMILKEIESSRYLAMQARCIIDDNPGCHGKKMRGIPIVGDRNDIPEAVEKYHIDEIIFAIPSASVQTRKEILEIAKETGCKLRTLPGMYQLINGDVSVAKLKDVDIEDLLGREPVKINNDEVLKMVMGKRVLVTGGGGSIGSELCRQIAAHDPALLIIFDIYENNAYDIQQELIRKYPSLHLEVLIGSVRNTARVESIFEKYRPDIVYHAAAHKHVPLMEASPGEAIKNNVMGTWKVAQAADKYHVERFVLISTDKAVNPTNVMGASKRICEMVIQMINLHSETGFVAVRFGNVLGSNGSVIPLFKQQIAEGGPVTVTDPEVIRYFMSIPEAVSLVLQAGAYARGGEVFVLDMGKPMKIVDLAENLIKLSGYRVGEDIEIRFTGLRPGEKMYEELLMKAEGLKQTKNELIYVGEPIPFDEEVFREQLKRLEEAVATEDVDIRPLIREIVPTYHYEEER